MYPEPLEANLGISVSRSSKEYERKHFLHCLFFWMEKRTEVQLSRIPFEGDGRRGILCMAVRVCGKGTVSGCHSTLVFAIIGLQDILPYIMWIASCDCLLRASCALLSRLPDTSLHSRVYMCTSRDHRGGRPTRDIFIFHLDLLLHIPHSATLTPFRIAGVVPSAPVPRKLWSRAI